MFVSQDCSPISEIECGRAPSVRPPWCRVRFITIQSDDSVTQQADFDQTDVNAIVERFKRTGQLPVGSREPQYADVTGLQGDFTELQERARIIAETASKFAESWVPPPPEPPEPPEPVSAPDPAT